MIKKYFIIFNSDIFNLINTCNILIEYTIIYVFAKFGDDLPEVKLFSTSLAPIFQIVLFEWLPSESHTFVCGLFELLCKWLPSESHNFCVGYFNFSVNICLQRVTLLCALFELPFEWPPSESYTLRVG